MTVMEVRTEVTEVTVMKVVTVSIKGFFFLFFSSCNQSQLWDWISKSLDTSLNIKTKI